VLPHRRESGASLQGECLDRSPYRKVLFRSGSGRPPESTGSGGAVAPPPPDPVSDDCEDGEGHDQEEGPLPPQPLEHRLHLLAEHVTEDDPQRGVGQRADQVVRSTLSGQEAPHDAQKVLQPVVMEPVAGSVDADHPRVPEVRSPPVLGRIA
jgi:hypothetical protein